MQKLVTETNPLIVLLNKSHVGNPRRMEIFELLQEFRQKPQLELSKIKEKNMVTALCWLQFNQIAIITHIQEMNGEPKKIYYGLTISKEQIPKWQY